MVNLNPIRTAIRQIATGVNKSGIVEKEAGVAEENAARLLAKIKEQNPLFNIENVSSDIRGDILLLRGENVFNPVDVASTPATKFFKINPDGTLKWLKTKWFKRVNYNSNWSQITKYETKPGKGEDYYSTWLGRAYNPEGKLTIIGSETTRHVYDRPDMLRKHTPKVVKSTRTDFEKGIWHESVALSTPEDAIGNGTWQWSRYGTINPEGVKVEDHTYTQNKWDRVFSQLLN